jgi:hypothetical protein
MIYHEGPIECYIVMNIDTGNDYTCYSFEEAEEYYLVVSDNGENDAWGIYAKL